MSECGAPSPFDLEAEEEAVALLAQLRRAHARADKTATANARVMALLRQEITNLRRSNARLKTAGQALLDEAATRQIDLSAFKSFRALANAMAPLPQPPEGF